MRYDNLRDIRELQDLYYKKLKEDLFVYITETCEFPVWKQVNYTDTSADLQAKKNRGSVTANEQTKINSIQSIRDWKNALLLEKERVKTIIYGSKVTIKEIRDALTSFNYITPPFPL